MVGNSSLCYARNSVCETTHRIKNSIHKDTQLGEDKGYLTVKQIYSLDEKGSLDFGGRELNKHEWSERMKMVQRHVMRVNEQWTTNNQLCLRKKARIRSELHNRADGREELFAASLGW